MKGLGLLLNKIIIILEFNYYKLEPSSSIMHYTQEDGSSLLSRVPQTKEITGEGAGVGQGLLTSQNRTQISILLYYYLGSIFGSIYCKFFKYMKF